LKKLQYMSLIGATASMIATSAANASSGDRADVYDTLLQRNPVTAPVDAAAAPAANPPTGKAAKSSVRTNAKATAKAAAAKAAAEKAAAAKAAAAEKAAAAKAGKLAAKLPPARPAEAAGAKGEPARQEAALGEAALGEAAQGEASKDAALEPRRDFVKRGRALGYEGSARGRFHDLIAKHAAQNGIPFALADAVVRVESRYNPAASNGGAVGLMQIKPRTARGLGYCGATEGLHNPETNILYGVKYLAQAYRMAGGDTCGTVMRYQSGHYAKRMNGANRVYCAKIRTIVATR
jgi:soluble lytic murein transglycosylase-like protein